MPRRSPVFDVEPTRTWLWSDLHLSDPGAILSFDRPFRDVVRMNAALLREWRRSVRPADTIICCGDVAHPDAWDDRCLVLDLRACPGRRVLILGNHDLLRDQRSALGTCGFEDHFLAALLDTDPPLALTHAPVARVPAGAMNVHGHLHGTGTPAPRRLDISVERTGYAPIRLDEILELARGCD